MADDLTDFDGLGARMGAEARVASLLRQGDLLWRDGRYAEGLRLAEQTCDLARRALGPAHPQLAYALMRLGEWLRMAGQSDAAEARFQAALAVLHAGGGEGAPGYAACLSCLAMAAAGRGQRERAEELYRQALALREQFLAADDPDVAQSLHNLASLYRDTGRPAAAEPLSRRALAIVRAAAGGGLHIAFVLESLAYTCREFGRHAEAEGYYRQAADLKKAPAARAVSLAGGPAVVNKPVRSAAESVTVVGPRLPSAGDGGTQTTAANVSWLFRRHVT